MPAILPPTQGIASYSAEEITQLSKIYKSGTASDAKMVLGSVINDANKALKHSVHAYETIVTSGNSVKTGESSNTGKVMKQSNDAYSLAVAYSVTGNKEYYDQAHKIIMEWAHTNTPTGDPIANAALMPMFQAYDLLQARFSTTDKTTVTHWMSGIADALIDTHSQAEARHSMSAINNHHSYELLEVGTIGAVLGNTHYIQELTDPDGLQAHIENNLRSFPGQPPYLGVDYDQRKAYHYVAYNLQALEEASILVDRLGHLPGNPYKITLHAGESYLNNTLSSLLPYASGEKQSMNEFAGSSDRNDATRIEKGSLSAVFKPGDALPVLEAAAYFSSTATDASGKRYDLAQLATSILKGDGDAPLSLTIPTEDFLHNVITSPYRTENSTTKPVKVPTDSQKHSYNATDGNDTFTFYKHTGQTTIHHFGDGDVLNIVSKIYASPSLALSHVQYSHGNAVLALDGSNSITLSGVADHALTTGDFHIF